MKTVLFIPGFQENIKSRDYPKTIRAIENAGYKVVSVDINWRRTTIRHWTDEFNAVYQKYDPENTILAGFSYGAMTAFVVAAKRSPAELWLFSLSPYFAEDISHKTFNKSWLKYIGHRREDDFKTLSYRYLIELISSKIKFFYGEVELKTFSDISYRHKIAHNSSNMETILIPDAKHDVASDVYVDAIANALQNHV